jgi:MFS family permease
MAVNSGVAGAAAHAGRALGPRYKWIALSNTTLGMLMATINQSIVLIALPDVFHGIGLNPLSPGNTSYLLWMFMGFLVVSAVLVVSFGRLGDMFGRVRMYTLGFAIFSVASIFLTVTSAPCGRTSCCMTSGCASTRKWTGGATCCSPPG